MKKQQIFGLIVLFITSLIWGCAFVAQKVGMNAIGPITFCGVRFLFSAIFMTLVVICRDIFIRKEITLKKMDKPSRKKIIIGGILCGIALTLGTNFQQYGMVHTTAGKSGFITALYIVMVPILGIIIGKKAKTLEWISVVVALVSLVLLCFKKEELTGNITINSSDILILICAFFFSIQILLVDYFSKDNDCILLTAIEFIVCAILSLIAMFIFEKPNIEGIINAIIPLLYAGVASGGIAYTLQAIGQKHTPPVIASIVMSFEAVISLIAGAILIHERLTNLELIGCLLMFIAIVIPQLTIRKKSNNKTPQ